MSREMPFCMSSQHTGYMRPFGHDTRSMSTPTDLTVTKTYLIQCTAILIFYSFKVNLTFFFVTFWQESCLCQINIQCITIISLMNLFSISSMHKQTNVYKQLWLKCRLIAGITNDVTELPLYVLCSIIGYLSWLTEQPYHTMNIIMKVGMTHYSTYTMGFPRKRVMQLMGYISV